MRNPDTGEEGTLALPASGWRTRGNGRYTYASRDGNDRVRAAIKPGGGIKVRARGGIFGLTLDEPSQRRLTVTLAMAGARYCTEFGGDVRVDEPGRFSARNADAPPTCQAP